jgi:D-threonate/D-erythronate kinase
LAPSSSARVLIIADDLTGALDTAGPFAQRGLATKVVAQSLHCEADSVRGAQIVSVNSASRHLPADVAAERVKKCARIFSDQTFDFVFKKIDSTLRGNVAAESMALLEVSGRQTALIAPAFPQQGRTLKHGVVHVEGVPLAQTGFARDALSPPPLSPLTEVFAAVSSPERVRSWRHGEDLPSVDGGVVIADTDSEDEMAELFAKAAPHAGQTLLVGSAGLGGELARHLSTRTRRATFDAASGAIVFVVGSRAARSREQVERLRKQKATVVLEAPNGIAEHAACTPDTRQIVLLAVEGTSGECADAADVARRLGATGLELADRVGADAMVVTGGDTAIALLEVSGCSVIDVCGNLMPGIPFSSFERNGRQVYLVTKAGGFGVADTLADVVRCLRTGAVISED